MPIDETQGMDPRVSLQINLPEWFPRKKIGIHVKNTAMLASLGGLKRVAFRSFSDQEALSIPGGVLQSDGSLAARAMQVEQESFYGSQLDTSVRNSSFTNSSWGESTVLVNLDRLGRQSVMRGSGVRDAGAWARGLDMSFRGGLRNVGMRHLWSDVTETQRQMRKWVNIPFGLITITSGLNYLVEDPLSATLETVGQMLLFSAGYNGASVGIYGLANHREGYGHRISLLPGIEFERMSALQVVTRIPGLLVRQI